MHLVTGNIKVQHGIYRIYEMLEMRSLQESEFAGQVAGYAIFDSKDQRLSKVFGSFQKAIHEINQLLKL